jgi:hypothetical protein
MRGDGNGVQSPAIRAQGKQVANLVEPGRARAAKANDWYQIVSNGRIENLMPPFANSLSPQDRWDVLAYVWSLGSTAQQMNSGNVLFDEKCVQCHTNPATIKTENVFRMSLAEIALAFVQGDHHKENLKLTDSQRAVLADKVRGLKYKFVDPDQLRDALLKGDGEITWQLVRQSAQNQIGPSISFVNMSVVLHAYDETSEVFSRTLKPDINGLVKFSGLPVKQGYFYEPEVIYNGARFFASPLQITNTQQLTRTFAVYDVANDAAAISISDFHYFVQDVEEGRISIVEVYTFDNKSDKAYIEKPLRSIKISVPPDATNIRFDGPGIGARFIREGNVLIDMDAVLPGNRATSVTMIYDMPYRAKKTIEREMFYPIKQWDLLMPDINLRAVNLVDRGVQQIQSQKVRIYSGNPTTTAPSVLRLDLVGQPRAYTPAGEDTISIIMSVVLLGFALALVYFVIMRGRALRSGKSDLVLKKALVHSIADLDQQFEDGKIDQKAYETQRTAYYSRLRSIWK